MPNFTHIDVKQAEDLLNNGQTLFLDVRAKPDFDQAHIPNAAHLTAEQLPQFIESNDKKQAVVVYCYHGISCQRFAKELADQGFEAVYSLDGGYEAWRLIHNLDPQ